MSNELPFVSCLCPTYRRPKLLENSIACFLAQDYPADRRELIVLDDAGELQNQTGDGWQIISIPRRLPHHISTHVRAMEGRLWSKPSFVLSSYTGRLEQEDATGRFHASLAFRREIFDRIGGWPLTRRGDFDQQLIARLNAIEAPGDPCQFADPSYIFRWGQTNAYHGQAFMQGPEDEGWYDRVRAPSSEVGMKSASQPWALNVSATSLMDRHWQ
ncbi:MAG: glycosyltransferase [Planctomycetaceae bacterium]